MMPINRQSVKLVDNLDVDLLPMDRDILANRLTDHLNVLVNPEDARVQCDQNGRVVGDKENEKSWADRGPKHPQHVQDLEKRSSHDQSDEGDELNPLQEVSWVDIHRYRPLPSSP